MSLVGKKFPSIAVDAISEMGDTLKINIFEEATNTIKKYYCFGIQKILHSFAQQNYMLFKPPYRNSKKEILW